MQETKVTDNLLLQRYVDGDLNAFSILYERHKGPLYRFVMRQTVRDNSADDLFQDIWSSVIRSAGSFTDDYKFTTWLYTIARNKVIDQHRHLKVADQVISEDNEHEGHTHQDPESLALVGVATQALKQCLTQIKPQHLECLLLKEEAGLSANAISQIINCNLEATKSRLRNAYKLVRQCVETKLGHSLL